MKILITYYNISMNRIENALKPLELMPSVDCGDSLVDVTANHIRNFVQSGALGAGARIPGVRHFAKIWPVSYVVIQKAFEKCANEGLLIRHPGRGTFVTDNRRAEKSMYSVYLVIQQTEKELSKQDYSASKYFLELAGGLQKEFAVGGIIAMSVTITGTAQENIFISELRKHPADIVLLARSKNTGILREISALKIPCLLIDPHVYPSGRSKIITHDERRAADDILNFFMEKGKERIGILVADDSKWVTSCRLNAIKESVKSRKAGPNPEWVKTLSRKEACDDLKKIVSEMFSTKRKPNALIVNGIDCKLLRAEIEKQGVPDSKNIIIASYDIASGFPNATMSIIIDSYEYGRTIGRMIYNKFYIEKETSFPEKIMIPFPVTRPKQ